MKPNSNKNTERLSTRQKKAIFLESLHRNLGVIEPALKDAGIARITYLDWKKKDETFARNCKDVNQASIEFVESKLYENIAAGKETSIIFYLKCRGVDEDGNKKYIDRQFIEQTTTFAEPLKLNIIVPDQRLLGGDDKKLLNE